MSTTYKIFLASSSQLEADREAFRLAIAEENIFLSSDGIFLEVVIWEEFLDAMSQERLQNEYNKAIQECDIFVMLYHTKVGKYTEEEFETAFGSFRETGTPKIFTYFRTSDISLDDLPEEDVLSLYSFRKKLESLEHFHTKYKNQDKLNLHFNRQIRKLIQEGFIKGEKYENSSNKKGKSILNEHHAYRCNRENQSLIFRKEKIERKKSNKKIHFFFLHGHSQESHRGLYKRFKNTILKKGRDFKDKARKKLPFQVVEIETQFPKYPNKENFIFHYLSSLMEEVEIDDDDYYPVEEKDIHFMLEHEDSLLNDLGAEDKVLVNITIEKNQWDTEKTPEYTKWFIEHFCKIESYPVTCPEFFFFFSIKYDETSGIKSEIENALKTAEYTIPLPELKSVKYEDIELWFNLYERVWEKTSYNKTALQREFFNEKNNTPISMEEVVQNLKKVINKINNDEKNNPPKKYY